MLLRARLFCRAHFALNSCSCLKVNTFRMCNYFMTTLSTVWSDEQLQESLHALHTHNLSKPEALQLFFEVAKAMRQQSESDSTKELQHLWLKLHRKYKFKFKEYEKLALPTSIYTMLFNEHGHGFQTVMRFYVERNLIELQRDLFAFGLATLLRGECFQNLSLYFCNCLICEEWTTSFQTEAVHNYFIQHDQRKVTELYVSYCTYREHKNAHNATVLYKLLKSFNPHYRLEAKATPQLFKQLHQQKQ